MDPELMSEEIAAGYVYILENDSMPGLIKIGRTSRDSDERAKKLSSPTGVPTPFEVAFQLRSTQYKRLEREMHTRLSSYRVASNREFFKYPIDKAIDLLKKLDTEKQNRIRPEVVRNEEGFINRVSGFFKRFFRHDLDESNKIQADNSEPRKVKTSTESIKPIPPVVAPKSSIDYIIKDSPLQNKYTDNTVDVNLNGHEPYYSEQNGFYWAANHQGIAECLPQHIKRIIHNEEVEIEATHEEFDEEIGLLRQDITKLNEEKNECDREIAQRTQEISQKKVELAGIKVQFQAFMETESDPELNIPLVEGIPDNSDPESVEELPNDLRSQNLDAEIEKLNYRKDALQQEIREKKQELTRTQEEFAGLQVQLQAPTKTELISPSEVSTQASVNWIYRLSTFFSPRLVALIVTIILVLLVGYLFIFMLQLLIKLFS